jgi:hypothetical protein
MRIQKRTLGESLLGAAVGAVAGIALTGCDDDKVVYVEDPPPAVPTGVTTITGDGEVEVLWYPVREDDVAGYGVYRNSESIEGPYSRIATLHGKETSSYLDGGLVNGDTYYYAVDAFDFAGHESALSYEDAFDTPRPDGSSTNVFALQSDSNRSGIDFSDYGSSSFVTAHDATDADVFFQRIGSVIYAKGTIIQSLPNDIQDLGYTESLDDISWAPTQGWSVAPNGVELIEGHTYVVWTWDQYFAKFRVVALLGSGTPTGAQIDWAYQIDNNNPELSTFLVSHGDRPAPEERQSS